MRINLHTHSNHSDGRTDVKTVLDLARGSKLDYFALSDHDTVAGLPEAFLLAAEYGVKIVPAAELSMAVPTVQDGDRRLHMLAYGFDFDKMDALLKEYSYPFSLSFLEKVKKIGGTLVWAHPYEMLTGTCKYTITEKEIEGLLQMLLPFGVDGIEANYYGYSDGQMAFLSELAKKHGLLVSAGTDFHGRTKDKEFFLEAEDKPNLVINALKNKFV